MNLVYLSEPTPEIREWAERKRPGGDSVKHAWVYCEKLQADTTRTCKVCGAKQTYNKEYLWGRVVSRQWIPLVGRCRIATTNRQSQSKHTPIDG
jgi:hypothetical protein